MSQADGDYLFPSAPSSSRRGLKIYEPGRGRAGSFFSVSHTPSAAHLGRRPSAVTPLPLRRCRCPPPCIPAPHRCLGAPQPPYSRHIATPPPRRLLGPNEERHRGIILNLCNANMLEVLNMYVNPFIFVGFLWPTGVNFYSIRDNIA
jgi:hypothetical protein